VGLFFSPGHHRGKYAVFNLFILDVRWKV